MPRWLVRALTRIRRLASAGRVRLTVKAARELAALEVPFDPEDVRSLLASLTAADSDGRLLSPASGEWLYVFKSRPVAELMYLKVLIRGGQCVIVSFHEEDGAEHEPED